MRSLSWRITKPINKIKRGLRKVNKLIKKILKSNKYTLAFGRKIKQIVRGKYKENQEKVCDVVNRMCPEHEWRRQRNTTFEKDITFSILVPLYNTPEKYLCEMIESVQCQTYCKWELCLADGSDDVHGQVGEICRQYAANDNRIKYKQLEENKGISGNTNACIDMATGDYIALFDHDDFLHPSVLFENMKAICRTGADFLYTDEAIFHGTNVINIVTKHYKPDFAIDNLRANNYICHFSVFSAELLKKTGRFRPEYDGSQDHDMILRLAEVADNVYHIPKILYYWRSHSESVASDIGTKSYAIEAAKRAVKAHLDRCGLYAEVESSIAFPTFFRIKYELKATPKISVIITGNNNIKALKRCVNSVIRKTTYKNYEIIIAEKNNKKYYDYIRKDSRIRVLKCDGNFGHSKVNNFCAQHATGDYLILLNNNTEIISENWIEELLMYAQRDDVAAVGAKIYYPDDTIWHAGIAIGVGLDKTAGYIHRGVQKDNVGYMGNLFYGQNVSAVSSVCMMVKASIYKEVGGLDENLTAEVGNIDFCLKVRGKSYLNIFTPYCQLYYYAPKSKDTEHIFESKDIVLFKSKWESTLKNGDPYYNPNFSLDRANYHIKE